MKYVLPFLLFAVINIPTSSSIAQSDSDTDGVRMAVEDYVLGFYKGEADRIRRSIREDVVKYGFYMPRNKTEYEGSPMSFDEMIAYCDRVKERNRQTPDDAPREIEILDVLDKTAVAKLTATWGVDYLHLAKYDDKWMIVHVLWQSHPPKS
ncbi:MAG: hypothetical protein HKN43_13350 [Rhodothermales bacterium]|nr:hypothetical protein [Rhodothermales bacterium]